MVAPARSHPQQIRLLKPALPYIVPAPPLVEPDVSEAVRSLRERFDPAISRQISSGTELLRALNRRQQEEILPTTLPAIDALLDGGVARGRMTEISGRGARFPIVIAMLAAATSVGEAAALIDIGDAFDPQAAEAAGIDLKRLLWIRPKTLKQAVAAAEMITATGFQLVVLDAGPPPLRGRVPDATWVRLARAAEAHRNALVISSPYPLTGTTSEAMLRAAPSRGTWKGGLLTGVTTSIRLEKHRKKRPGESARVAFDTLEYATATRDRRPATDI
jgi:hypothetical protein